jgi:aminotransferase
MKNKWVSQKVEELKSSPIRKVFNKVAQLKSKGIEVIDFSIGRPFFDTPSTIKEETKRALDKGMVHYTGSTGILELRNAIVQRILIDKGVKYDPDEIIVTIGGTEGMFVAIQTLLSPGDEIIVPDPMYVYYKGWINYAGAKCVPLPLKEGNFSLDIEGLKKNINSSTKMILINSPHNPTGSVFSRQNLEEIAKLSKEYDLFILSDEIYQRITYDNCKAISIASFPQMKERTIISDSFSKTYAMDGWRVGYLAAPREIINQIAKLHQHIISCSNTFVQIGATVALNQDQQCVEDMVAEFTRRRELTINYLKKMKLPFIIPRGAFYVFPSIKEFSLNSEQLADYLLKEARVAVVPGNAFGDSGEGYIRLSFSPSYEEIESGLQRMEKAIRRLRKSRANL